MCSILFILCFGNAYFELYSYFILLVPIVYFPKGVWKVGEVRDMGLVEDTVLTVDVG